MANSRPRQSRLLAAVLLGLTAAAGAQDAGNHAPPPAAKFPQPAQQNRVRDRQGGDTLADAFVIPSLPYTDTGTTLGYLNDYDAACPYSDSTAPDVVYAFTPATDVSIDIDLCGSGYDTKIYVMAASGYIIACNDDFYFSNPCGVYVSKLEDVVLQAGGQVYIVIDGYQEEAGDYNLLVEGQAWTECYVAYPPDASDESEPSLVDNYNDHHNSGCNSDTWPEFQQLPSSGGSALVYGRSGWYYYQGSSYRDTDWFMAEGAGPTVTATVIAEEPVYLFHIGMGEWDCNSPSVEESVQAIPCETGEISFPVDYREMFCVWVGPTVFSAPDGFIGYEFNYVLVVEGIYDDWVPTEVMTWGAVKALYD